MDIQRGDNSQSELLRLPVQILRQVTRTNLSSLLNPIQVLPNASGILRDHRGLAEVAGLTHTQVRNVERTDDPTGAILKEIVNLTLQDLLNSLEKIERFDIIEDTLQLVFNDAHDYKKRPDGKMTISSGKFDAFVCYCDEDLDAVTDLANYLESDKVGLKLWIRHRDLPAGEIETTSLLSAMAGACDRMLVVCSAKFFKSPQAQFQLDFAAGLVGQEMRRRLIPVIIERCDLPPVMQMISKIDLISWRLGQYTNEWTWSRLVSSIRSPKSP